MIKRDRVTDAVAHVLTPATAAPLVPTATRTPVQAEQPVRQLFTRPCCHEQTDDPVATELQRLINEHSHHVCVCSPNRSDMLRAEAEMKAHPGYAEYKARRDAAMKRTADARS